MSRPTLEVADIFRIAGARFLDRNQSHVSWPQLKVMRAIERCRTAALGGHHDQCTRCHRDLGLSYNSCRNRHCPKCQTHARNRWLAARTADLVPVPYFHVVFTVPHELSALMLQNKRTLYSLLFRASADALLEMAANPARLGAEIGFFGVLHTWGQTLEHHAHVHYVVPAGGFSPGRTSWVRGNPKFFLPVEALSQVFRGKFVEALRTLFRRGKLVFAGALKLLDNARSFSRFLHLLHTRDWVVYAKKPFGGPEHVLHYLGRYTHRVAISNHRLLSFQDGRVTFRWRDYAHGNKKRKMTLSADEFIRRFLLHVLPRGFVRIRYFGWMANRHRTRLAALCRAWLDAQPPPPRLRDNGSGRKCPWCGDPVITIEIFTPLRLSYAIRGRPHVLNSS
jgi:hypothetical protein